ncbi:SurA N-terminal domain-containing protein [Verrucomicrobiaceae bacterium N1E253]|uniref:SurA N-terminal domain-containing protein n=1 Tax=Oceaniferula marina TaxID=2748318 RepID=A0A851GQW1_9BACT|nr:SurA N-terminal domain-containing protein [Oceaniferula marina]NWK57200.1 SurA N-terminal domain-containing protein [Oceaniferula marina]
MRKYTGLMAVVFVLLGAGFLFTMNDIGGSSGGGGGSGPTMLEVYGESYNHNDYQRMGGTTLQLANEMGLHNYINLLMAPDAEALQQAMQLGMYGMNYYTISQRNLGNQDLNRFIANRVILQHAMNDMGIHADEDEVSDALKTSPIFTTREGNYNETAYAQFVDKRLGRLGMTEKDMRSIIRESLCLNKLVAIVGGGLTPLRSAAQDQFEAQNQTVTLAKITFNRDDFVEKENPSEEEIKAYWESHQDAYKTDEQRQISYIMIDLSDEVKEATKEDKPEEKPEEPKDESKMTEAEKEADKTKKEAEAKEKAEKAEQLRIASRDLAKEIKESHQDILDSESAKRPLDFKALMAKREHSVVETELFTRSTLPKELKGLTLRGRSNKNMPIEEVIFSMRKSDNNYDHVSDPLPVGESAHVIFVLKKVVEPVLLTYETARNKARANLIGENATKKVKQAAKDQRNAIVELMKSGKSFDESAKEKGLTPVQVGPFSLSGTPPKDELAYQYLHEVAQGLNPGEVSETIDSDTQFANPQQAQRFKRLFNDRAIFFYVDKRELEDTEQNKLQLDRAVQGGKADFMIRTYLNWMHHQYAKAEVKGPATEQQ